MILTMSDRSNDPNPRSDLENHLLDMPIIMKSRSQMGPGRPFYRFQEAISMKSGLRSVPEGQIFDFQLKIIDFRVPTIDFRVPTIDFRVQIFDFRVQIFDFRSENLEHLIKVVIFIDLAWFSSKYLDFHGFSSIFMIFDLKWNSRNGI